MINNSGRIYGTRKCLQCGQNFEAQYAAQVVCSKACAHLHRNKQKRESASRLRAKNVEYLRNLLAEMDRMREEIASLKEQLADARNALSEVEKDHHPVDESQELSEPDKVRKVDTACSEMKECKRMHLRAMNLPCGLREECFTPICEELGIDVKSGEKVCPTCKKAYTPNSPAQKFCSPECRRKGNAI